MENLGYLDLARQYPEVSLADLNEAEGVPVTVWDVKGNPLPLGLVAAGTDAVALDATLARLMGLDPREIGYLAYAARLGLGTLKSEEIEVMGLALADCRRAFELHSTSKRQREWHFPEAETLLTRIRLRLAPGPSSGNRDFPSKIN